MFTCPKTIIRAYIFIQCNLYIFVRYAIIETDGYFELLTPKLTRWVHVVMVYHGVEVGITVYQDGMAVGSDNTKTVATVVPQGDGVIGIGRKEVGSGPKYASVHVDEIKFFILPHLTMVRASEP